MKKTTKDRIVNIAWIVVVTAFLVAVVKLGISPWCWIPLGLVLLFFARPVARKALYNEIDCLEMRLRGGSEDERESAARALAKYRDPRVQELLLTAINSETPKVLLAAAQALLELGDERATELLKETLRSDRSFLRKKAAQLLADSGWQPQTPEERVNQWIAFGDFTQPVGGDIAVAEALAKAFEVNHTDGAARTDIVWALSRVGTPEVVALLLHRMRDDKSMAVRYSIEKALKGLLHLMTADQKSEYVALSSSSQLAQQRTAAAARTARQGQREAPESGGNELRCQKCGNVQRKGDWEKAMDARSRAMGRGEFINLSAPEECLKCGSTDLVDASKPKRQSQGPSKEVSDLTARFARAGKEWEESHALGLREAQQGIMTHYHSTQATKGKMEKEIQRLISEVRTRGHLDNVIRELRRLGEKPALYLLDHYLDAERGTRKD